MAPAIQGMKSRPENGGTVWTSETTGMVLVNDGSAQRYTLKVPGWNGLEAREEKFAFLDEAVAAYAKAWIEWAAVTIGLGFHPDTSCGLYEPPLEPALAAEYDQMISLAHETGIDPYAVGLEAWERAGMLVAAPGTTMH